MHKSPSELINVAKLVVATQQSNNKKQDEVNVKMNFDTKLTELELTNSTLKFLNKIGLYTIRDVMEEGKTYLLNNAIKKENLQELLLRFRELGIVCKDEEEFIYIGNLEDGVTGVDYLKDQKLL